jgi:hypothetical protein
MECELHLHILWGLIFGLEHLIISLEANPNWEYCLGLVVAANLKLFLTLLLLPNIKYIYIQGINLSNRRYRSKAIQEYPLPNYCL